MSTATAEPPAKTQEQPLAPLEQAFGQALKEGGHDVDPSKPGAKAPTEPKQEQAKPAETKPVKTETETKPVEAKPAKKKSALEAAMAEETPEAKPEVDEVTQLLESKDPNWQKARETLKKQSDELKAFREKVAKANEPPPEVSAKIKAQEKELSEAREQLAKYKDAVTALDVKYDPNFQAKYVDGRAKLVNQAAAKVGAAGGNKEKFLEAMEMTGARRSQALREALGEIEGYEKASIETRLGQIDTLEEERDEQLKDPHKTAEEWQRQRETEARQHEEKIAQFKAATFEKIGKKLQKESPLFRPAPADSEGAEEYNAALKADMERAIELTGEVSPEDATIAAYRAQRFDTITKQLMEAGTKKDARISELEETLAKFEGAETGYRGGKKPATQSSHEVPLEKAFMDALNQQAPV